MQLERQLACSHCPVPAAVAAEVAAAAAAADSSLLWAALLAVLVLQRTQQLVRLGANWRAPRCRSLRDVPRAPAPWQPAVS